MKKSNVKISLLIVLMLVLTTFFNVAIADSADTTITILQTADMHGRIYAHDYATDSSDSDAGLAKIETLIKVEKAKNPDALLIDCGDTVQDNSAELFNDLPVHPMIQALNEMGYDIWSLGNHEFNFEKSFLDRNIAAFEGTVVSANIYKTGTDERFVDGYKIFDVNGVKVAVIGMVPPNIPLWEASAPSHFAGLEFKDVAEETEKVIGELEGKYDVLVGAYHIGPDGEHGYEGMEYLAENFPEFDVIFGGHAHSKYQKEVNGVQLIEPGKYGWALAKADIQVVKNGEEYDVVSVITENIETKPVEGDAGILDTFKFVHDQSVSDANTVVGTISNDFILMPDYITGEAAISTMPTSQIKDTSVIDLINEVQMFYSSSDIGSAALFNFGSNLLEGEFKKKDVAYIYKYPNTLVGVNITGENLLKYMEWSAGYYNTTKPGDVTVSFNKDIRGYNYDMFSGVDYEINLLKEVGNRVENVIYNGEAIDPNKVYKLSLNNYRFGTLMGLGLVTMDDKYYDSYELYQDAGRIRDLIIKYTVEEKQGNLAPTVDNNWKITNFDFNNPYKDSVFALVKSGDVLIPTSEDGRTSNVEALNLFKLKDEKIIDLNYYTVKTGDVLWKIAKNYGMTWTDLSQMNGLSNPNLIFPSQQIIVPQ
ncbi:5'-nucleotidase C-terminal domain-containing protein [Clostridiaceae bacterium HSG29]|nr:5'-nucleotidase C-terminal domain-containing protein [Clostridiaceae bacterium HSG29]